MKSSVKKALKITAITLGSFIVLATAVIGIVIYFIFTPARITPIVRNAANEMLDARLDVESVELTFFSTFPQFGLKITNGLLLSESNCQKYETAQDSLLSFTNCSVTVNPIAYLLENKISVQNLSLDSASIYAYKDKEGKTNWEIFQSDTTVAEVDTVSSSAPMFDEISIRKVRIKHANIIFNDRSTDVYARIEKATLRLGVTLNREGGTLKLRFRNKNLLFWQNGELLTNKLSTSLKTDIILDRATRSCTLKRADFSVNGVKLNIDGTFVRDTVEHAVQMDVRYGVHAPSVEKVLAMIPNSIVKHNDISATGSVKIEGTVQGAYGKQKLPMVTLCLQIEEASAQYKGLPYGIDHLSADFDAQVDLMRQQESFLDLKIFKLEGMHTEVLATAKATDLFTDPLITLKTCSKIDLDALAKTFPLQEGVSITGKIDADLNARCRLSAIRNQDFGRIQLFGDLDLSEFRLTDTNKDFDFTSHAQFKFSGKERLEVAANVDQLELTSPMAKGKLEELALQASAEKPQDTLQIVPVKCSLELKKLRAKIADSTFVYSGKTKATVRIRPRKEDATKPIIHLSLKTDSLFGKMDGMKASLNSGGFKLRIAKQSDSIWNPRGTIAFDRFSFSTPHYALPIRVKKTEVTLGNKTITLKNASIRAGRSNVVLSGSINNLYKGITKGEMMKGNLDVKSKRINCNQLINAMAFPQDSVRAETDTTSTDLRLFAVPKNIDFELNTDIKKVIFDNMVFENIVGKAEVKDQHIYLENLQLGTMDAQVNTSMIYRATSQRMGYTGFDLKVKDINIGRLVEFAPSLDTIVPMLRSFKGRVNVDVAAEAVLDSTLTIQIPTLRAAMNIKGDSLVLMDGETFAEISKILMFKNKKENMFDSISVNITVKDGNVNIYPFIIEIDRYKAAAGGHQDLNMNFDYHVSILKSPLPFKAGVNIKGNLDKMKFGVGKAKYKDAVTPAEILKVDSTRINMSEEISRHFKNASKRRAWGNRAFDRTREADKLIKKRHLHTGTDSSEVTIHPSMIDTTRLKQAQTFKRRTTLPE